MNLYAILMFTGARCILVGATLVGVFDAKEVQ